MGRKPKDLTGQKFGMLTVKDMIVGMKLMYQRQDLYKGHVIVVVVCRKKIVKKLQIDDILWTEPVLKY